MRRSIVRGVIFSVIGVAALAAPIAMPSPALANQYRSDVKNGCVIENGLAAKVTFTFKGHVYLQGYGNPGYEDKTFAYINDGQYKTVTWYAHGNIFGQWGDDTNLFIGQAVYGADYADFTGAFVVDCYSPGSKAEIRPSVTGSHFTGARPQVGSRQQDWVPAA